MKVLMLGGSRFIGKRIAETAAAAGHEVHLFNRGQSAPESPYPLIKGDLAELAAHREAFAALAPDVIVHCMAFGPEDAERARQAFKGLDAQLFVLGSADCYEAFQGLIQGIENSDWPLTESDPTAAKRFYYRDSAGPKRIMHDYDKNLLTDALFAAGAAGELMPTVFRVPMVWGPEDYQFANRHGGFIRRIHDQRSRFVMGASRQNTIWHFGYIDNIAAAIVAGFGKQVANRAFNLGEQRLRSWRRWAELFGQIANQPFEFEILPDDWLDVEAAPNAPPQHVLLDTSAWDTLTGFREPVAIEDAIARTLEWGLAHLDAMGPAPDYEAEDRALAAYTEAREAFRARTKG